MAIQEFEKISDGRENHNSSGLRASFGGSSGLSLWAGLLVSARRRSYQEKRTFGVHALFTQSFHSVCTFTSSVWIESFRSFLLFARTAKMSDMSPGRSRSTIVLSFCNDGKSMRKITSGHTGTGAFRCPQVYVFELDIMRYAYFATYARQTRDFKAQPVRNTSEEEPS